MTTGVLTPCQHRYHSECFFKWIFKNRSCPLCRKELIALPNSEEHESLNELHRQIEWEGSLYNTLRSSTDALGRDIHTKKEMLRELSSLIQLKELQLVAIIDRYRQFIQHRQRNQRSNRRSLFFKN